MAGMLAAGAIAGTAPAQTAGGAADSRVMLGEVDAYRLALLKMRGHLAIARALIQVDAPGAGYHMTEAMRRTYESAEAALTERSAPLTGDTLSELENAAGLESTRALRAIESAEQAVNGSFAQTGAMDRASVLGLVEALLSAAVANYAEAVEDNTVVDTRRYQTGRGYVIQAEALVRHSTALADAAGQERLLKAVTLIRQTWPGITPPPIAFDPAGVAGRLDEAVAIMEEMR